MQLSSILLVLAVHAIGQVEAQSSSLPQVDLGYEIHQAASYNVRLTLSRLELS